ncbi:MAG: hypothetical protein HXY43_23370 [Fischerella sp.]|nr:hypothetical protein [Fischerella sp.]NWF62114.1 hypothetical protein [Fischerella sp.]
MPHALVTSSFYPPSTITKQKRSLLLVICNIMPIAVESYPAISNQTIQCK